MLMNLSKGPPTLNESESESCSGTESKRYCSRSGLNDTGKNEYSPPKRCHKRCRSLSWSRLV